MNYLSLPFISKVTENQKEFGEKVIAIGEDIGVPPSGLMVVMNNESGLNHRIKNPTSTATGLIQFTEATAKDLGTTTAALKAMSNVEQLDYVKEYFTKYGYNDRINDVGDTYLAVFYPLALYKDDDWEFPKWAVDANKIFDVNKDGKLTKAEFKQYVDQKYGAMIPKEETEEFAQKKNIKRTIIIITIAVVIFTIGYLIYFKIKK